MHVCSSIIPSSLLCISAVFTHAQLINSCMQTIYAFSYTPGIATGTASAGTVWRMAYQQSLQLYKGITNTIRLVIYNNNQKVVDLSDYDIEVQIVDRESKTHLLTITASVDDPESGIAEVTFTDEDTAGLDHRFYHMIARLIDPDDGSSYTNAEILYLDDNHGVFLPVQLESAWDYTP